jgi:hypothetical protein
MPSSKHSNNGSGFGFQYAAKVVCTADIPGTSQSSAALLPGVYETGVNIHNPHSEGVKFRKKVAVPGQISDFIAGELEPDGVSRVTCREMVQDFGITFIHGVEGFLVIEATHSLDVTAVYTAGQRGGEVVSIDVEQVPERRIS